ncbi:MAG: RluA family pseudouridine synthase [Gammaproteobacteria bacterium]|nr:RluA family pseudouridine synthase [Gammaproteobacteria bacterium]
MDATKSTKSSANKVIATANADNQRLDNFVRKQLGLPLSAIYRLIRKGQVRVNGGRKKPDYRLSEGDEVRLPPKAAANANKALDIPPRVMQRLAEACLVETEDFMVINKPAGMAVHGGSGLAWGVIDVIKSLNPQLPDLELAHRLDRDTSGCLFLAKNRRVAQQFQQVQKQSDFKKIYRALLLGQWHKPKTVRHSLDTENREEGERHVVVSDSGKTAISHFRPRATGKTSNGLGLTDMEVTLETGRTHQIRVHSAAEDHPIIGDSRYGDAVANPKAAEIGFKRLQLHAWQLQFEWRYASGLKEHHTIKAPLDAQFLNALKDE